MKNICKPSCIPSVVLNLDDKTNIQIKINPLKLIQVPKGYLKEIDFFFLSYDKDEYGFIRNCIQ